MILEDNDPFTGPSFTLGNRILRFIWSIIHLIFFKLSPTPFHKWRIFVLRLFGAKIGRGCHIYPSVKIWAPWNLIIGDYVGIADGVTIYNMAYISIGDFAVISQGVNLCCGSHDYNSPNFQLVAKPILIEKKVWICAEAFVHPNVIIPEGVVIGARSVVHKQLSKPWVIYSGNPCVQIANRKKHN